MVNSFNRKSNYFTKQKINLDYLFNFIHFSCSNFCQIQKYAKLIHQIKNLAQNLFIKSNQKFGAKNPPLVPGGGSARD